MMLPGSRRVTPLRRQPGAPAVPGAPQPIGDATMPPPDLFNPSPPAGGSRSDGWTNPAFAPTLAPSPIKPPTQPMPGTPGMGAGSMGTPGMGAGGAGYPLAGGSMGYAAATPFGPGADLRGTQISPADSAATQAANGAATQAMGAYTSFQGSPFQTVGAGSYAPSADAGASRSALMQAIAQMSGGASRTDLATGNYDLLRERSSESMAQDVRRLGQANAKFGRIGSGMTTTALGDMGERMALADSRDRRGLSLEAAAGDISDRFNRVGALGSVTGLLGGEDRANAGVDLTLRNEARGERDARGAYENNDFARRAQLFGDTAAYASGREAKDAGWRDELRGERGWQAGMEGQAYDRNRQAIGDAQAQQAAALNQALALMGAGQGADLSGLLAGLGAQGQAQAGSGFGDLAELLRLWNANRG